jgi:asparagine synthetase B (glutamine-hydrolysing)
VCWPPGALGQPGLEESLLATPAALAGVTGRFAMARQEPGRVRLARDKLGLNKLFFAIDAGGVVTAANYLIDLVDAGVPFDAIYAVPAGTAIEVDLDQQTLITRRYHALPRAAGSASDPVRLLNSVAEGLERHFELLAAAFPRSRVTVCLSGGADSALVAAHAKDYFPDAVAYTYMYRDKAASPSEDAVFAERVAAHLGMPFRPVAADTGAILRAVGPAIRFGQDWRDFNVHCAIVNEILATAIAADARQLGDPRHTLVLTGDLMNEILADYTPVHYRRATYYQLPAARPDRLRISLVRGIQTGDREVGVFASHGLDAVQPYASVFEQLLGLPSSAPKREVIRALAAGRLPAEVCDRPKARAQVGDSIVRHGILPVLADSGRDARWLEDSFREEFKISGRSALRGLVRAGVYRPLDRFPDSRHG